MNIVYLLPGQIASIYDIIVKRLWPIGIWETKKGFPQEALLHVVCDQMTSTFALERVKTLSAGKFGSTTSVPSFMAANSFS